MNDADRMSVRQIAERLGWSRRATLERLEFLHMESGGGLLYRRNGHRTKFWVDGAVLSRLWPDRFGGEPTANDLAVVHDRIDHVQGLAERALRELGQVRKHGVGNGAQSGRS